MIVGYRLDLWKTFSITVLGIFLVGACAIKLLSVGLGARLAGFRGLDILNLAIATNARGGPGIVLASVAYDAGIVNATAYTTLVLLAVLTSQAAGAWLEYVLRKGWALLTPIPLADRPWSQKWSQKREVVSGLTGDCPTQRTEATKSKTQRASRGEDFPLRLLTKGLDNRP